MIHFNAEKQRRKVDVKYMYVVGLVKKEGEVLRTHMFIRPTFRSKFCYYFDSLYVKYLNNEQCQEIVNRKLSEGFTLDELASS